MRELVIDARSSSQRLDKFLKRYLPHAGSSLIYKQLRKKNITLNQKKAQGNEMLSEGDVIRIYFSEDTLRKFTGADVVTDRTEDISDHDLHSDNGHRSDTEILRNAEERDSLQIIFENPQMILMNKPAGILSQKAGREDVSMVELLQRYLQSSGQLKAEDLLIYRPGLVNRIDRNTSGMVIGAKTLPAARLLSEALRERTLHKYYLALVIGSVANREHKKAWLRKDRRSNQVQILDHAEPGCDPIETKYRPIQICSVERVHGRTESVTLLRIELITGKTHQIRSHLSAEGHPLIGDSKYGEPGWNRFAREHWKLQRQFLHACEIVFPEGFPVLDKQDPTRFRASLPEDLQSAAAHVGISAENLAAD